MLQKIQFRKLDGFYKNIDLIFIIVIITNYIYVYVYIYIYIYIINKI